MFAYTSLLHLYIVHIRYFMTVMHGRLDDRHRRPLNLDHLKYVTVGTCRLNNIYNLEHMMMLFNDEIAALFSFHQALYVVRFRQAVVYMMQYHVCWAFGRGRVQRGVVEVEKPKSTMEPATKTKNQQEQVPTSKYFDFNYSRFFEVIPSHCKGDGSSISKYVAAVDADEAIDQETNDCTSTPYGTHKCVQVHLKHI